MRTVARLVMPLALSLALGVAAHASPGTTVPRRAEARPTMLVQPDPVDLASMTPAESLWFSRLLAGLDASRVYADNVMLSGDSYTIGRDGGNYVEALLMALRATGDRRFLDRVLELTNLSKLGLRDAWLDGTTDGYTDWLWLIDPNDPTYYGKDTNWLDESIASGNVALWTYAFHLNRHVDPAYAAAADYWRSWLENHFLGKWYSRVGGNPLVAWNTPYAAFYKPAVEPRSANWRLAYYLWKVTGNTFYLDRTTEIRNQLIACQQINPSVPTAYRWARELDPTTGHWQAINYANYYMRVVLEMNYENEPFFNSNVVMKRFASTFRDVVYATSNPGLTTMKADVNGGGSTTYALYAFNGLSRWDSTGFLVDLANRSITGAGNYAPGGLSKAARNDAFIASYALAAMRPNAVTATLLTAFQAVPEDDGRVRIEWLLSTTEADARTRVHRLTGDGAAIAVGDGMALGAGPHVAFDSPPEGAEALTYELRLLTVDGEQAIGRMSVRRGDEAAPEFALAPAEPNPFADGTTVRFALATAAHVRLAVHDAAGRLVRTLRDEPLAAGSYAVRWDGRDAVGAPVRAGVYFVVASDGARRLVRRAVRIE